MALTKIDDRGLKTPVDLLDSEKIRFGTGNDLEIFHDNNSKIVGSSGYTRVAATAGMVYLDGNNVYCRSGDGGEYLAKFIDNGASQLFYDNSLKFETTTDGIKINGKIKWDSSNSGRAIELQDNQKIFLGNDNDLKIYHDGTDSFIDNSTGGLKILGDTIRLKGKSADETMLKGVVNGEVELYHNNVKKFETTSTGAQITGNLRVDGLCDLYDDKRIRLGDSADFQLFHVGGENFIRGNASASPLYIDCCENLHIRHLDTDGSNSETMIKAVGDGAVELYHNNSLKLHTSSDGVTAVGYINNQHLRGGSGDMYVGNAAQGDLYIYVQDNTNNSIILQANTGEKYLEAKMGGAVDLYHHGSKKFETFANGIDVSGQVRVTASGTGYGSNFYDSVKSAWGDSQDLQLYHNGTNAYFLNSTGNFIISNMDPDSNNNIHFRARQNEDSIVCYNDASTDIYYDGAKKFETTAGGAKITGNGMVTGDFLVDSDSGRLKCGLGEDLQIYHNGSNSFIENTYTSGDLYIRNNGPTDRDVFIQARAGENSIICKDDESVQLYYDGIKKFETRGYGARVFGHLGVGVDPGNTPNGRNNFIAIGDNDTGIAQNTDGQLELWSNNQEIVNIDTSSMTCYKDFRPHATNNNDLGSTSYRWRNLYVNDAHFSNEGGSNSVDGTWGDWTLQEGEEDIFMLNNRTGKKYKMALTEVN